MNLSGKLQKHWKLFAVVVAGVLAGAIALFAMCVLGYAPFGDKVIAVADARIQYLDFFSYLRQVIFGKDGLLFSFAKGLGGSGLALFAYYLASPLNILAIFFPQGDLGLFFNILFIIKVILAASFFAVFLTWRFQKHLSSGDLIISWPKCIVVILLSASYGLSQYMLAQSSNIMWLDGVYMLPLILLGVSRLVRDRKGAFLAATVGLTILFNWYTGGIDCLFAIIWFCLEIALKYAPEWKTNYRTILSTFGKFIISMAIGVLISSVLFIPTVLNVLSTGHSTLQLRDLLTPTFVGQFPSAIERYSLGADSIYGAVSLFCGSLAILGAIMLFLSKHIAIHKKIIFAIFAVILLLIFYWQPLVMLFSMLEGVGSYWYRYSYVAIAGILFMSAYYFCRASAEDGRNFIKVGLLLASLMIVIHYSQPTQSTTLVYATAIFLIATSFAFYLYYKNKRLGIGLIVALAVIELSAESFLIIRRFQEVTTTDLSAYTSQTASSIDFIGEYDAGEYRISQTSSHYITEHRESANFNEPLAYGYKSIASYTSLPKDIQLSLLENLGYRKVYNLNNIITTSIIAADSLLGVKYLISDYNINGLKLLPDQPENPTGRQIYENPYALPMALTFPDNDYVLKITNTDNPFIYQNELFSKLVGEKVELYRPLDFVLVQEGDVIQGKPQKYQLKIPKGNYAIYGNIPASDCNPDMVMDVNGEYATIYARGTNTDNGGLSPSVFYIPTRSDDTSATIELQSQLSYHIASGQEQFYALDLDLLAKVSDKIRSNSSVTNSSFEQTEVLINAEASNTDQILFISMTYDRGWTITRNGEPIEPQLIAGTFYAIPLVPGDNQIKMTYHEPGLLVGTMGTFIGILGVIGIALFDKKSKRRD